MVSPLNVVLILAGIVFLMLLVTPCIEKCFTSRTKGAENKKNVSLLTPHVQDSINFESYCEARKDRTFAEAFLNIISFYKRHENVFENIKFCSHFYKMEVKYQGDNLGRDSPILQNS
jgi:hypothetical protein